MRNGLNESEEDFIGTRVGEKMSNDFFQWGLSAIGQK